MSETTLALVAALIGACGAVSAAIVASILNARRENRRLKWEQTGAEKLTATQERRLFLDAKRQCFAAMLRLGEQRFDLVQSVALDFYGRREVRLAELKSTSDGWWQECLAVVGEIALPAPEVNPAAREQVGPLSEWESAIDEQDYEGKQFMQRHIRLRDDLQEAMRKSLGVG